MNKSPDMPGTARHPAQDAFDRDDPLCERCQLRFREYIIACRTMRLIPMWNPVNLWVPDDVSYRLPMCRSGAPLCDGARGAVALRFGEGAIKDWEDQAVPLVKH